MLFYVVLVCKCVLQPGDNTIAVNKYIKYQKEVGILWGFSLNLASESVCALA
jgi:hypothetical protein